jgi:hypothetical protein
LEEVAHGAGKFVPCEEVTKEFALNGNKEFIVINYHVLIIKA